MAHIYTICNDIEEDNIRSTEPAGRVMSVAQSVGLFTHSLLETDRGFFSLADGVSMGKGEELSLQTRGNGARFLCDSQQYCMRLNESRHKSRRLPAAATASQPTGTQP